MSPIVKPEACKGCPFYHHGKYFTPDKIVANSQVMFIAQNPGPDEEIGHKLIKRTYHGYGQHSDEFTEVTPQPLIGATGQDFERRYLPLAGLKRDEISLANAIRCRPGHGLGLRADELPPLTSTMRLETSKADVVQALRHCRDNYLVIPPSVRVIVTMGRYAMFSLTGIQSEEREYGRKQGVMESWRGYGVDADWVPDSHQSHWKTIDTTFYHPLISDKVIFFTMHIASLYKPMNKRFTNATLNDFDKIKRLLQRKWPVALPMWSTEPPKVWPGYAVFDSEYIPGEDTMTSWSLCDMQDNLYNIVVEDSSQNIESNITIEPQSTILIQNAVTSEDIAHLSKIVDISQVNIEDLMLADSVLWTGEPHSLNFIASKYGYYNRFKHLPTNDPLYGALDAKEPKNVWLSHYLPEFTKDKLSWGVYKKYTLPLIQIIRRARRTGARVDTARLIDVQHILQENVDGYIERAREITGNTKFNIGGMKEVRETLYG